jgi:3-oxoadipate enol-lactonase
MKISANGISVQYELTGPAGAPVVVLSHSLAATMAMWDAQMAALTGRYQVLRYDLRGHGGSDAPAGAYSFEMLAADVAALLGALEISRCHFVGLSIGGMIGQALGIKRQAEIVSLALCATASRVPPEIHPVWDERMQQVRTQGMASMTKSTLDRWFTAEYCSRQQTEVTRIAAMIASTPVNGYVGCASAIKTLNFAGQLNQIAVPTLLMVGRQDPGTPVLASEVIQREIPGSKLVILENAMHLCNIEQADAFNRALLDFLPA